MAQRIRLSRTASWLAGLLLVLLMWGISELRPAEDVPPSATATAIPAATQVLPTATQSPPAATEAPSDTATPVAAWSGTEGNFDYYVLALSWQPAFCETKPGKEECIAQTEARFDAKNFALHGLWPNVMNDPNHRFGYCDLSQDVIAQDKAGQWCDMPPLDLSTATELDLSTYMPGTASCLQNHEWYKHGVCTGMSPDDYYALADHLVSLFDQTAFNQYIAAHIGETVSRSEVLAQFEREFGDGSANYLTLRCRSVEGTSLLTEIQIVLQKDLSAPYNFRDLFPDLRISPHGNCPVRFKIDRAGLDNF